LINGLDRIGQVMKKGIRLAVFSLIYLFFFSSSVQGQTPAYSRATYNPDKNDFLTVWTTEDCYYGGCDAAIYGAFIDKDFNRIGAAFPIADVENNNEIYPEVVYNKIRKEFMVVYQRCDGECLGAETAHWNIYAARVKDDGSGVFGPYEVYVDAPRSDGNRQYDSTIAYDEINDRYLVAFMGLFNESSDGYYEGVEKDVKVQLLSGDGQKIGPSHFLSIDEAGKRLPAYQERPDVVFIPEKRAYYLVWEDHRNGSVAGTILDADGNFLITPKSFFLGAGTGNKYYPQLEYNRFSTELWATWENIKSDRVTVEAQRISTIGSGLGETIIVDDNAAPVGGNPHPGLGCDWFNGSCLTTWMDSAGGGFKGQFFDAGGQAAALEFRVSGGDGGRATIIFNGLEKYFLVLKTDQPNYPIRIEALPGESCLKWNLGNLNCDAKGLINETDLTMLLGNWGGTKYNFTGSLTVGQSDLSTVLANWLN
jgi:hypothetical protein